MTPEELAFQQLAMTPVAPMTVEQAWWLIAALIAAGVAIAMALDNDD